MLLESGADPRAICRLDDLPGDALHSPVADPPLDDTEPGPVPEEGRARADSCFQRLVVALLRRRERERHGLGDRLRATAAENLGDVKSHL